jgi:hypothetical protein
MCSTAFLGRHESMQPRQQAEVRVVPKPPDAETRGPEVADNVARLMELDHVHLLAPAVEVAVAPEEDAAPVECSLDLVLTRLRVDRPVRTLEEP